MKIIRSICCFLAGVVLAGLMCEPAAAQMPWRGHYMRRDGLFHVERYHWGGGITDNGASVLNTAIPLIAPIVGSLLGKDAADSDASTRSTRDTYVAVLPSDYITEQRSANDLLERSAALVNNLPPTDAAVQPELSIVDSQPEVTDPHGIAVTVGVNFLDLKHYGSVEPLRGCARDAQDMRDLANNLLFECEEPLLDEHATRAAVQKAVKEAAKKLDSGDMFLFYFAGYGAQTADLNGDERSVGETDAVDETLCLYDGMLLDDELLRLWKQFKPGVRVVAILDCGHNPEPDKDKFKASIAKPGKKAKLAGFLTKESKDLLKFRSLTEAQSAEAFGRDKSFYTKLGKMKFEDPDTGPATILISACRNIDPCGELPSNGVFTGALKQVWNKGKFKKNYKVFLETIGTLMPSNQLPSAIMFGPNGSSFADERPFTIVSP